MERDFSETGLSPSPNNTGDYICCVCGDNAPNYRSVKVNLDSLSSNKIFSGFMEPPLSATLAEFSSGEL